MQGWSATTMHGVERKRSTKRLKHTGNLFRKKRCLIIPGLKQFNHRSKESILWEENSRFQPYKETVDKDIHITSRRQKSHVIYQNNEQTSLKNKEVEPVEQIQMNIYQSKLRFWASLNPASDVSEIDDGEDLWQWSGWK